MTSMKTTIIGMATVIGGLCLFNSSTLADPVDNPGQFVWELGGGAIVFNQSAQFSAVIPEASGSWDTELASNGDVTFNFNSWTLAPIVLPGTGYSAQIQVDEDSSSGALDASLGGYNASLTMSMRIRITGGTPSVGSGCWTPFFDVTFEGAYQYGGGPVPFDRSYMYMYTGTGGSGSSGWVVVPAITVSCNGQASTVNNLLDFGSGKGALEIARLGAMIDGGAGPQGS